MWLSTTDCLIAYSILHVLLCFKISKSIILKVWINLGFIDSDWKFNLEDSAIIRIFKRLLFLPLLPDKWAYTYVWKSCNTSFPLKNFFIMYLYYQITCSFASPIYWLFMETKDTPDDCQGLEVHFCSLILKYTICYTYSHLREWLSIHSLF